MNLDDPRLLLGILQGMPEALVLADVRGVIRFWNAGAERLFGYPASEAMGAHLNLIVPERFRAAHDAGFERAVASGELRAATRVLRTRASHKQGNKLYVDFTFALLKDASGTVIGVYAIGRDATEAHLKAQGG